MSQSFHGARRLGVGDVAESYGLDALRKRIAQLHECGMHYAAVAIERELTTTTTADDDHA